MAHAVEDMNFLDLEESLLWTDDEEGPPGDINSDDEEMLLNDPIQFTSLKKCKPPDDINGNDTVHTTAPLEKINNINNHVTVVYDGGTLNTSVVDEINLDITLGTRGILEASAVQPPELDSTLTADIDTIELNAQVMGSDDVTTDQVISEKRVPEITADELAKHILSEGNDVDKGGSDYDKDATLPSDLIVVAHSNDGIAVPEEISATLPETKVIEDVDDTTQDVSDVIAPTEKSVTVSDTEDLTVIDSITDIESDVAETENSVNSNSVAANTMIELSNADSTSHTDIDCEKAPLKRAKATSSADLSHNSKRMRRVSAPLENIPDSTAPTIIDEELIKKKNDNEIKMAKPQNEENSTDKKKIVRFNCIKYSNDSATNPYVCIKCAKKIPKVQDFEAHLISLHASSLKINDFEINLHQHYKDKRVKLMKIGKPNLPRLTLQDAEQSILDDYFTNVQFIGSNRHFLCKICENIYSNKNLIIEHLKSSKHLIRKSS